MELATGRRRRGAPAGVARTQSPLVRVGTDVQPIAEVSRSLRMFGDRYTRRLFRESELLDCSTHFEVRASQLAARFAAKEAVFKLLRVADDVPPWTSIEIRRTPGGWPEVLLHDEAAELARRDHVEGLSVSLSHAGGMATATVVAQINPEAS